MTPQEIFDFVAGKLEVQKRRSAIDIGPGRTRCQYLTDSGDKCAVGHILPTLDVSYRDLGRLQGYQYGVKAMIHQFGDILPDWFKDNYGLLTSLQLDHDTASNWENNKLNMRRALFNTATKFNLKFDAENWN